MDVSGLVENSQDAKESIELGSKIIFCVTGFLTLLVVLAYINISRFDINYLTPFVIAGIVLLVKFNLNKLLSLLLLVFPSLIAVNVIKDFDLNGSFWLVAPPFILHIIFVMVFYYGCFKLIEGVFAYHRTKELNQYNYQ